ncbi:RNA polymerase sigma factor [Sphingomonas sp. Sphisp140]|uniref:RNA polymerase sigma factor n=1 Tax=unclassified Sphingomonas TaxID=196159 RepID=UPI0039AF7A63
MSNLDRDKVVRTWFCEEVLPLEGALLRFIRRNWPAADDATDLMHDVYELAITGARNAIPHNTAGFLFAVARNHLINRAKRARIVSFELVADLETVATEIDIFEAERQLHARDTLRRVQAGIDKLSPRVREIVLLRKVEGLDVAETSQRLGIGKDAVNHQLAMGMKALADHMLGGAGKIVRRRYSAQRTKRGES